MNLSFVFSYGIHKKGLRFEGAKRVLLQRRIFEKPDLTSTA